MTRRPISDGFKNLTYSDYELLTLKTKNLGGRLCNRTRKMDGLWLGRKQNRENFLRLRAESLDGDC